MKMSIPTSDDSGIRLETEIEIVRLRITKGGTQHYPLEYDTDINMVGNKDPIHDGLVYFFEQTIKDSSTYYHGLEFGFYNSYVIVEMSPYTINGTKMTLRNICHILSRMAYASINDKNRQSLGSKLRNWMIVPNDITYVLENRVPYHWYESGVRIDVRLNVKLIGQTTAALEISDGIWGQISFKNLNVFLGFYLHNSKKGSWKHMSPAKLYERLLGEEANESDLEVMLAFLSQNRTSKIVEERAKELLVSMSKQYSDRMYMTTIEELIHIRVRGKLYDWLLVEKKGFSEQSTQKVSVYVLGAEFVASHDETTQEEIDTSGISTVTNYVDSMWKGPICIDNMARGSSLGDQFASRIFAVMNDSMTVSRVSTLSHYLDNPYPPAKISLVEGLYVDDDDTHYQSFRYSHRRLHSKSTTTITTVMEIEEEFK